MADQNLEFQFSLKGAEEIIAALKRIASEGSKTFQTIRNAAQRVGGQGLANFVTGVRTQFLALQKVGGTLVSSFSKFGAAVTQFGVRLSLLGGIVSAAVVGFVALVKGANDAVVELGELAQSLGFSVEFFSKMRIGAIQAGASSEEFGKAMARVAKFIGETKGVLSEAGAEVDAFGPKVSNMNELLTGGAEAAKKLSEAFGNVGVVVTRGGREVKKGGDQFAASVEKIRQAAAKVLNETGSLDKATLNLFENISKLPAGANRNAIANKILGRSYARLLPFIDSIGTGLSDMAEKLKLTEAFFKRAQTRDTAFDNLSAVIEFLKFNLADVFGGALASSSEKLTKLITGNIDAILNFGKAVGQALEPEIAKLTDTIITWLSSLTVDDVQQFIQAVKDFGKTVGEVAEAVKLAFGAIFSVLTKVAEVINTVFGTKFTGITLAATLAVGNFLRVFSLLGAAFTLARAALLLFNPLIGGMILAFGLLKKLLDTLHPDWFKVLNTQGFTAAAELLIAGAKEKFARGAFLPLDERPEWREFLDEPGLLTAIKFIKADIEQFIQDLKGLAQSIADAFDAINRAVSGRLFGTGAAGGAPKGGAVASAADKQFEAAEAAVEKGKTHFEQFMQRQGEELNSIWDAFKKEFFSAAEGAESGQVTDAGFGVEQIEGGLKRSELEFVNAINDFTANVRGKINDALKPIAEGLSAGFKSLLDADFVTGVTDAFTSAEPKIVAAINAFGTGLQTQIADALTPIGDALKAGFDAAVNRDFVTSLVETLAAAEKSTVDAINAFGTRIQTAIADALRSLGGAAAGVGGALAGGAGGQGGGPFSALVSQAETAFTAIKATAEEFASAFGSALDGAISKAREFGTALKTSIAGAIGPAIESIKAQLSSALGSAFTEAISAAIPAIASAVAALGASIGQTLADAIASVTAAFASFAAGAVSQINSIIGAITSLIAQINAAIVALRRLQAARAAAASSESGFARGGFVSGPGSSTSDSIFARLSNGEFVMNAWAVRKFGLAFMRMLNRGQLPQLPKFSAGGFVGNIMDVMPSPALSGAASSTAAGVSGRPVFLNIGGEQFPMSAGEDTIKRLQRVASRGGIVSAGRKPRWYG
jgi:hypothetical protein